MSDIITSKIVDENKMLAFLPRKLPRHFLQFESLVYSVASKTIKEYSGGEWDFMELSNQGLYLRPSLSGSKIVLQNEFNGYNEVVSEDAAGIIVTALSLYFLHHKSHGKAKSLYDYLKLLMAYINFHNEKNAIHAAVSKQK